MDITKNPGDIEFFFSFSDSAICRVGDFVLAAV
jgi:hypothetical protein